MCLLHRSEVGWCSEVWTECLCRENVGPFGKYRNPAFIYNKPPILSLTLLYLFVGSTSWYGREKSHCLTSKAPKFFLNPLTLKVPGRVRPKHIPLSHSHLNLPWHLSAFQENLKIRHIQILLERSESIKRKRRGPGIFGPTQRPLKLCYSALPFLERPLPPE